MPKAKPQPAVLKGWKDIAHFLGQPTSTASLYLFIHACSARSAKGRYPRGFARNGHFSEALKMTTQDA